MTTELVFRFDYGRTVPWVQQARDGLTAIAGPDALAAAHAGRARRRGLPHRRPLHGARGRDRAVPALLLSLLRAEPERRGARAPAAGDRGLLARWTGRCRVAGPWRDAVHALADHAQGADLRRRPAASRPPAPPRCPSSSAAAATGTTATAGSATRPSRSTPSCSRVCKDEARRLARMAAAGRRRQALAAADPLWGRRRAMDPGAGAAVARRLRGQPAGADRQRGARAAAARRLRRAVRRVPRRAQIRACQREDHAWARREGAARLPRARMAAARPGHLGGPRTAAALHPLQGDGLGGGRSRGQGGRALRARRPGRALARAAQRGSTPTSAPRASIPSATASSSLTAARRWTPRS